MVKSKKDKGILIIDRNYVLKRYPDFYADYENFLLFLHPEEKVRIIKKPFHNVLDILKANLPLPQKVQKASRQRPQVIEEFYVASTYALIYPGHKYRVALKPRAILGDVTSHRRRTRKQRKMRNQRRRK